MNSNLTAGLVSAFSPGVRALVHGDSISSWSVLHARDNDFLKLEVGMSRDDVLSILGKPGLSETYANRDGEPVTIWFYETPRRYSERGATSEEIKPVMFRSGRLAGWGTESYELKELNEARTW